MFLVERGLKQIDMTFINWAIDVLHRVLQKDVINFLCKL